MKKACKCGNVFDVRKGREDTSFYCSRKCFGRYYVYSDETRQKMSVSHLGLHAKEKHPFWKGRIKRSGYWYIRSYDHPNKGKQGYVAEHRLVMEQHLGRFLSKKEVVHHINEDKEDNRIENLMLCESAGKHVQEHHPEAIKKAFVASLLVPRNIEGLKLGRKYWPRKTKVNTANLQDLR